MVESTRQVFVQDEPGNTFLCRVLPDMVGLGPKEQLPKYPVFLADEQNSYSAGDVVWVICTEDFQIGYILGLAETPIGTKNSAVFLRINEVEKAADLKESAPADLCFEQRQSAIIDFYNKVNQQSGRIYKTGVIFIYGADGSFHMSQPNAAITITPKGEITVEGKTLTETVESDTKNVQNTYQEILGSKETSTVGTLKENVAGGRSLNVTADNTENIVGNDSKLVTGSKTETIGTGRTTTIASGNDGESILLGNYTVTILAGNIAMTTGTGTVNISAALGAINISAPLITLTSSMTKINGPITLPTGVVVPSYIPGFNCIPVCPLTGLPHGGQILLGV